MADLDYDVYPVRGARIFLPIHLDGPWDYITRQIRTLVRGRKLDFVIVTPRGKKRITLLATVQAGNVVTTSEMGEILANHAEAYPGFKRAFERKFA